MAMIERTVREPLATIWEIPDELWGRLHPILERRYPRARTGRPRAELRRVLDGIVFRMRSGCQWNQLPERFGSDSTVHRWFQRFVEDGLFEELWALLAGECDQLGRTDRRWQAADGCLGKARMGGEKRAQSHGSRQARNEEESARGGGRRPARSGDRGRQRPRLQAARADDRGDRLRASRPDR